MNLKGHLQIYIIIVSNSLKEIHSSRFREPLFGEKSDTGLGTFIFTKSAFDGELAAIITSALSLKLSRSLFNFCSSLTNYAWLIKSIWALLVINTSFSLAYLNISLSFSCESVWPCLLNTSFKSFLVMYPSLSVSK